MASVQPEHARVALWSVVVILPGRVRCRRATASQGGESMWAPALDAVVERRLLMNYRADPDVVARLVPTPLRPLLRHGQAVVGICLLRLGGVRGPRACPASSDCGARTPLIASLWSGIRPARSRARRPRTTTIRPSSRRATSTPTAHWSRGRCLCVGRRSLPCVARRRPQASSPPGGPPSTRPQSVAEGAGSHVRLRPSLPAVRAAPASCRGRRCPPVIVGAAGPQGPPQVPGAQR